MFNALLHCHKTFVDALRATATHPKLADHFLFRDRFQPAHGHAMHYLNQYFAVYGLESSALTTGSSYLERLLLQAAVLSLVLKVTFQDYVLEHLPIVEQLDLFNDGTPEFAQAKSLYSLKDPKTPPLLVSNPQSNSSASRA